MPTSNGKFTVSSAYNLIRQRRIIKDHWKFIWIKGVPFKIIFFLWRLSRFKLLIDEFMRRCGKNLVSRCRYCLNPHLEIVYLVFISSDATARVLSYYALSAGLEGLFAQCHHTL